MSILSDINKTINDADMYIWYKQEYIPFVLDHIEDVIEATSASKGFKYGYCVTYAAYLPDVSFPKYIGKDACMNWLLDNHKICQSSDNDETYYTDDFLTESGFMAHQFSYYWSKAVVSVDNQPKDSIMYMTEFCLGTESFKPV